MKPIKIAQIGVGHDHAVCCWECINKNTDIFETVGLVPVPDEYQSRLSWKQYEGAKLVTVEELLAMDDLDAVAIETGKEYSVEYAQMFADKGIPVYVDKPGSADFSRWEKFVTTMKEKQLPLSVGYMYRFNPMVQKALEMKKNGEFGEIFAVEAQMSVRHDTEKRRWLGRYKGGTLYFLGCHLVDMICQFAGFPDEVIPLSRKTGNEDVDAEDYGFAVFKYKNGISFCKACSSELNGFDRRQLVVSGTKATIEIRPWEVHVPGGQRTNAKLTVLTDERKHWQDDSEKLETEVYDRYLAMMTHFAKMVRGEAEMVCSYDYEIELLRHVIMACGGTETVMK